MFESKITLDPHSHLYNIFISLYNPFKMLFIAPLFLSSLGWRSRNALPTGPGSKFEREENYGQEVELSENFHIFIS